MSDLKQVRARRQRQALEILAGEADGLTGRQLWARVVEVIPLGPDEEGHTKDGRTLAVRTSVTEWRTQGRNTYGVTAMKLVEQRGSLVGALICGEFDEFARLPVTAWSSGPERIGSTWVGGRRSA